MWHRPSSSWATWNHEVFATLLRGSANSHKNSTLPAVANDSRLEANLRRHLLLSCLCQSTCSVLSASICRTHTCTTTSAGIQSILNPSRPPPTHTTTSPIYTNLNSDNIQQRQINTDTRILTWKPLNQFSLRGTFWNLPSSSGATWHYELFAMPLLGSDYSRKDPSFPAVSTGSRLQANLRLHLLLACLRWSTCSVLSESICRKHVETAISAGIQSILNLNLSRSTPTHTSTSHPQENRNANNFQQRQINTCRKQESRQHPSTISLCEARAEICLLQVEPFGTMQSLPRWCWDPMTGLKIQGDQVAALQRCEEIQDTTFFAMFFRKDVHQMIMGGDWKVQGTPQVRKVSESGRSEVARVDLNGMFAQWSNHGFGHLTTGAKPKRHCKCNTCTPNCPASESFVLKAATKEER